MSRCIEIGHLLVNDLVDIDAEMLSHEANPKFVREPANLERLSSHSTVDHVCIPDDSGQLGVAIATHRAFVDVGGTNDSDAVVSDENLIKN